MEEVFNRIAETIKPKPMKLAEYLEEKVLQARNEYALEQLSDLRKEIRAEIEKAGHSEFIEGLGLAAMLIQRRIEKLEDKLKLNKLF